MAAQWDNIKTVHSSWKVAETTGATSADDLPQLKAWFLRPRVELYAYVY
jgi:hypothetical protein